jgi:hypothetical protein
MSSVFVASLSNRMTLLFYVLHSHGIEQYLKFKDDKSACLEYFYFVFLVPSLVPLKPQKPYDPRDHHGPLEV